MSVGPPLDVGLQDTQCNMVGQKCSDLALGCIVHNSVNDSGCLHSTIFRAIFDHVCKLSNSNAQLIMCQS